MRETVAARRAWADYLALGDGRSLESLAGAYRSRTEPVPTRQTSTLKAWSVAHDWQGRLKRLADDEASRIADDLAAHRRAIMEEGFALDTERVTALKRLAGTLLDELEGGGRLWVTDKKGIGGGEHWTQVDVERFNGEEVSQLRGLLDDLARETGGRQKRVDVTSAGQRIKGYVGIDPADV